MPSSSPPGARRRRLGREERRALILDAADRVLAERDPNEVTLEEIADVAGISRALIYNYFADRNALLEALGARLSDEIAARVRDVLSSVQGLRAALEAAVRVHLGYAHHNPRGYRLAFVGSETGRQEWVQRASAQLGDSPEGGLAATGIVAVTGTLVLAWRDSDLPFERAVEVITAMLAGAYAGLDGAGVALTPTWPTPADVSRHA